MAYRLQLRCELGCRSEEHHHGLSASYNPLESLYFSTRAPLVLRPCRRALACRLVRIYLPFPPLRPYLPIDTPPVHRLWQSVCTSIHTQHTHINSRAHTSPTASICTNLGLPSNFKPHKCPTYVCSAHKINICQKIQLIQGISSSRSSRQLADGCVCAHTHITHAHSAYKLLVV